MFRITETYGRQKYELEKVRKVCSCSSAFFNKCPAKLKNLRMFAWGKEKTTSKRELFADQGKVIVEDFQTSFILYKFYLNTSHFQF